MDFRSIAGAATVALVALPVTLAVASNNVSPSSAPPVPVGVPFTGTWDGTPHPTDVSTRHWWRLESSLRPGDSITLAIDNSASLHFASVCLTAPVDDFGADEAVGRCRFTDRISPGRLDRVTVPYNGATGQPFLIVSSGDDDADDPDDGSYTATIERLATRVNIGSVPPRRIRRTFTYTAALRYGDNTSAGDGLTGFLQWRRAPGTRGPRAFTNLDSSTSAGGALRFRAKLPRRARKRVQLRACVQQPGSNLRCTRASTAKLRTRR